MKTGRTAVLVIAIGVAVLAFVETYTPYYFAERNKPAQSKFLGQIGYTNDHDMYFSFIRQAYEGHVLFTNRLTGMPCNHAFFNLEFLAVGLVMRLFHLSETAGYQLWRFAGALLLGVGFGFLACVVLPDQRKRIVAVAVFLLAGGFGVFFEAVAMRLLSSDLLAHYAADLWAGVFPLQQIMVDPHFSLPHGLLLIGVAFYLLAERRNQSVRFYLAAGFMFFLDGFVRPYDLISVIVVISAFAAIKALVRFDLQTLSRRIIPLVMIAPPFGYAVILFKFHPVFHYWAQQGHNMGLWPAPYIGLFSYGIIGLLAVARMFQIRRNPLSLSEQFLVMWFAGIFSLCYVGLIVNRLGFSPQLAIPLLAPLVVLAFGLRFRPRDGLRNAFFFAVAVLLVLGNVGLIAYYSQQSVTAYGAPLLYATKDEADALQWLAENMSPGNVVLAVPPMAGRISKYSSASSVLGHYSVTPNYWALTRRIHSILAAPAFADKEYAELRELGTDFLVVSPEEKKLLGFDPDAAPQLAKVYSGGSVAIYKLHADDGAVTEVQPNG